MTNTLTHGNEVCLYRVGDYGACSYFILHGQVQIQAPPFDAEEGEGVKQRRCLKG